MGARHSLIVCGDLVGAFHSAPNWRSPVMGGLCTRDGEQTATGHAAHHQRRHSTKPRLSDGTALLAEPARRKPGPVCPSPREAFLQNYLLLARLHCVLEGILRPKGSVTGRTG